MKKRLKLPNGFGSVVYYGDSNRRQPYVVKKTISGRQKIIGQFSTYAEGLAFLVEYNKNPSLFSPSLITFAEVYELIRCRYRLCITEKVQAAASSYVHIRS